MILREEYSREFLEEKLEEYSDTYSDTINEPTKLNMSMCLLSGLSNGQSYCTINQFYHEYGLIKDKLDIYYMFRDALKEIYSDLQKRKVVDIGAGQVPQLAREIARISDEQIIAVDKAITQKNNKLDNLVIVKGIVDENTVIENKDLLIGCEPCEVTMTMIDQAAKNDIDFAIAVCDCTYMDNYYSRLESWHRFLSTVDKKVENSGLGDVNISRVGVLPLIYTNKRRK